MPHRVEVVHHRARLRRGEPQHAVVRTARLHPLLRQRGQHVEDPLIRHMLGERRRTAERVDDVFIPTVRLYICSVMSGFPVDFALVSQPAAAVDPETAYPARLTASARSDPPAADAVSAVNQAA